MLQKSRAMWHPGAQFNLLKCFLCEISRESRGAGEITEGQLTEQQVNGILLSRVGSRPSRFNVVGKLFDVFHTIGDVQEPKQSFMPLWINTVRLYDSYLLCLGHTR